MRRSAREGAIVAITAAALVAIELWITNGWSAITRPLWLDEIHTLLIADRGDVIASMRALAAGADTNPPTLFLAYRLVGVFTDGLSEVSMRLVATASVVMALAIVYMLLRDELGRVPAAAGALALWAQSVVVDAAFGARFYGPWLLSAAALVLVLRRVVDGSWSRRTAVALALVSVVVCTIHYFGIVSWAAGVAAALALGRARLREVGRRLLPAIAGPATLAACMPFYVGQRSALSVATWIPKASVVDHLVLLAAALVPLFLVVAVVSWGASSLLRRGASTSEQPVLSPVLGSGGWLLLSQVGVPVGLVLFSLLIQPATQLRYWIPGSLAVACVVALAVSRSVRPLQWVTLAATLLAGASAVRDEASATREFARVVAEDSTYAERAVREKATIVARRRHTLYPMLRAAPAVAPNAILFGGPSMGRDSLLVLNDLDIARVHDRLYGFPRIATTAQLGAVAPFYFVELDSARTPSSQEFPGRVIERVAPRLFLIR